MAFAALSVTSSTLDSHLFLSSSAGLSSISSPLLIIPYFVAIFDNSSRIWLEMINVVPFSLLSFPIMSLISMMPWGSRPFIGSSSTTRSGFPAKAIPIPSLCFIPSEKFFAFFFPVSSKPMSLSSLFGSSGSLIPISLSFIFKFISALYSWKKPGDSISSPLRCATSPSASSHLPKM